MTAMLKLKPAKRGAKPGETPILRVVGHLALHRYPGQVERRDPWVVSRLDGIRVHAFDRRWQAEAFLDAHGADPLWVDLVPHAIPPEVRSRVQRWVRTASDRKPAKPGQS